MIKSMCIFIAAVALSACSVSPVKLDESVVRTFDVQVKQVVVDNLASEAKISAGDVVYVNGWAPGHAGFSPPLHDAFVSKMKGAIVPAGGSGRVDVSVLRVGFFVEKNVADDVIFVGLFMVGRERGFKCDADVNIKKDDWSKRLTVSHEIRRPYFDDTDQLKSFVETCHTDLIQQISKEISKG